MDVETRFLNVEDLGEGFAIEERSDGRQMVKGYAARFNSLSHPLGPDGFRERLLPGAFDEVLQKRKNPVFALFNHSKDHVLGSTASGTLSLRADEKGLFFEVDMPDTSLGRDLATLVRRGDVTGASFAFSVDPKNEERSTEGKTPVRTIRSVSGLFDCSIVTTPAYPTASVALRWLDSPAVGGDEPASVGRDRLAVVRASVGLTLAVARMKRHG